jgi:hypothetical protein
MSMPNHISMYYLRSYTISHNSQCWFIVGTLYIPFFYFPVHRLSGWDRSLVIRLSISHLFLCYLWNVFCFCNVVWTIKNLSIYISFINIIIISLSHEVGSVQYGFFFHSLLSLVISMLNPFILLLTFTQSIIYLSIRLGDLENFVTHAHIHTTHALS